MEKKKYFVTTPIYYASGDLHVGHCFCTVLTDACARYKRLQGYDVMFLTGSDEHGMKIVRSAEKAGLSPKAFVDKTVEGFKTIWKTLGISYDKFIRTTDSEHVAVVQKIMQKLYDKGDIYLGKYEGQYCVPCETFFAEGQLVEGNCPDCGRPVEKASEECYFLKLSKYQSYMEKLFKENPKFLVPESRKNEIYNNFIKTGVQDLCITRTSFSWGIKAPFDPKHIIYVWCDALINYISALGYGEGDDSLYKKYWPADVHFIGRDISRFHAIIWPILLEAIGVPAPKQIHSTGFITLKGDKISKSKSNGFNPVKLCERYGADSLRYYMMKEGPIYTDIPYGNDVFLTTINSDLCNSLGNLVSRTLAMICQNFGGVLPKPNNFVAEDEKLIESCNALMEKCHKFMDEQRVDSAISEIFNIIYSANKYIDVTTPWILAKSEEGKTRLATVLYTLSETIRICTVLLQGFLVEIPSKIFSQFSTPDNLKTFESAKSFSKENFGNKVEKGEAVFPRLNLEKELKYLDDSSDSIVEEQKVETKKVSSEAVTKDNLDNVKNEVDREEEISIDYFDKIKLAVGTVVKSEKVDGADKLLKNTVEVDGKERIVVSGIAKHYTPEDIVGKQVIVVANLKPVKLRGILSEGMLLCAVDEKTGKLSLVAPSEKMSSGSIVC